MWMPSAGCRMYADRTICYRDKYKDSPRLCCCWHEEASYWIHALQPTNSHTVVMWCYWTLHVCIVSICICLRTSAHTTCEMRDQKWRNCASKLVTCHVCWTCHQANLMTLLAQSSVQLAGTPTHQFSEMCTKRACCTNSGKLVGPLRFRRNTKSCSKLRMVWWAMIVKCSGQRFCSLSSETHI